MRMVASLKENGGQQYILLNELDLMYVRCLKEKMMKENEYKLTLDRPITYQIKVPGHLDESWVEWSDNMKLAVETDEDGLSVTTLTSKMDQAALIGILRRLYSLGLPLISVMYMEG